MIRQCLLLALVATLTNARSAFQGKIIGGERAVISDFPYQVSVQLWNEHYCGGTIVSKRKIITAAHCTYDWENVDQDDISIRAGSSEYSSGGQVVPIVKVEEHPLYNDDNQDYDIAILTLLFDLEFNENVQPIAIATSTPSKGLAWISGWGATYEDGDAVEDLRYVRVPLIPRSECRKILGQGLISENMICAGYEEGGKDACQGDSGGPLVLSGKLIGVVSWGIGCGVANSPGVFTDVASLLSPTIEFYN